MAATAYTQLSYPIADFTNGSFSGEVNDDILKQELITAGLPATSVSSSGTVTNMFFDGYLSPTDISTADTVVSNHTGSVFSPILIKETDLAEESDDTGNEITKLTLDTGPQQAGTYLIGWRMEMAITSTSTTTACRAHLNVQKNGGSVNEQAQDNWGETVWSGFSGSLAVDVEDGDQFEFSLTYERIGDSGNAARAQRARMTWVKINS